MNELRPGMHVSHPVFGSGVIREILGSGPDARITVDFAANVGQKKLQAGVARLTIRGNSGADSAEQLAVWFECLDATCIPKAGRRSPRRQLHDEIREEVTRHDYWSQARDAMRNRGAAPRVLDNPSGEISISTRDWLAIRICIRHRELLPPDQRILAETLFQRIRDVLLGDFDSFKIQTDFGVKGELAEMDIIKIADEMPESLPDRTPRRNPLPVRPKGVISNRPRRRDDY